MVLLKKKKQRKLLRKLSKWFLPLILIACEPEVIYVDRLHQINDTLYVQMHDTSYVQKEAAFGLATNASIYPVGTDSIALEYWYALTKLDTTIVDSVFLIAYLLEWDAVWGHGSVMDKTIYVPFPHNAGDWNHPYSYSQGDFPASKRFARTDWADEGAVTYTMELNYK